MFGPLAFEPGGISELTNDSDTMSGKIDKVEKNKKKVVLASRVSKIPRSFVSSLNWINENGDFSILSGKVCAVDDLLV